ncbi:MAG: C-GCAxxG-C-C family protein [Nitrospirota bacterium]|nr:C-GCAxxG-C-C family protein [Nitrospirota bacterium]
MKDKEIKRRVYGHFRSDFHCAEAISKAIAEEFSEGFDADVIRCASGFGGGIGGSGEELCGAFTGGIIALSYFLGRENPGENLRDCGVTIKEFKKQFLEKFGSTNCKTLIEGFKEGGDSLGCVKLTADATVILACMLNEFEKKNEIDLSNFRFQMRDKSEPGCCPYSGSCQTACTR